MSCSCCCCVAPSRGPLEGTKEARLFREEEEEEEEAGGGGGEEEESRRNMDISLLREQYRCTRDRQRRHTHVLLFRTVSEELSEAVSIIPVTQGLTSPWKPSSCSPLSITFDPDPVTYDPWHVHLDLHRRCCPGVTSQLTASSPETANTSSSSRRSSSSSEAVASRHDEDSDSSSSSVSHTKEEDHFNTDGSRGDPDTGSSKRSVGDPEKMDPVQVSLKDGSKEDRPESSCSVSVECSAPITSDESSTPVASITCSPSSSTTSLQEDLKEGQPAGKRTRNTFLQNSSTVAWRGSRKSSAPGLRFTRQLSIGGLGSSMGVHQNQNYHPFPSRKTPRISEAARRLGMYSSF
ncbi:uncharacterized protein LOC143314506 [Chaetodon auriga]|uniref:uncharacterized protein LOC143314506 n=1 Tax=Chaetodon auriga TaxID=39042 RepID=UPI004032A7F8